MPPEPPNDYEHLRLQREEPVTERHRRQDRRPRFRPDDPRGFGRELSGKWNAAKEDLPVDLGGFDDRKLVKIILREGESLPDVEAIPGVELVSHEDRSLVLAFATEEGIENFESRLATLAREGTVTRREILYAIDDFGHWSAEDRTGAALRTVGWPQEDRFVLDVELWPQERRPDRHAEMLDRFRRWSEEHEIEVLDTLNWPSLVMARVRCSRAEAEEAVLVHRDVRTVDLPPRLGIATEMLRTDIGEVPPPAAPEPEAPAVAILDSGLTTGHPLIAPAVGDAQGFVSPHRSGEDAAPNGHGTFVVGIALYGDVSGCLADRRFVPQLRLLSGKVFKDDGTDQTEFVERAVEEAVRYFVDNYGCRVFNLCYGDLNKVYDGRHLRGLAYLLDHLSRTLNVLFVTATGNRTLSSLPDEPKSRYPRYLLEPDGRILDPGTAINAVTVGGLARYDAGFAAQRHPNHIETVLVAEHGQPSPITRCGPSINGAIKPDFVEHAGNVALDRMGAPQVRGLGVVSLNSGFAAGPPFCEDLGTSYAAPAVAHKAAMLLRHLPDASPNLLRALLGAHGQWPDACVELLDPKENADGKEDLLRVIGYGRIDDAALYRSLDRTVSLIAEESIAQDRHHFFEIPVPASWWAGPRRRRAISVALAYTPDVRTTRLDYRATRLRFSFVNAEGLDAVSEAFRRNREQGMPERGSNRWISSTKRDQGTLQVSRWTFGGSIKQRRLFVVVTRRDASWSMVTDEPEAYALAVTLDDRERVEADLYAEVRASLQARIKARARA